MTKKEKEKIIAILKQILFTEDVEIKDCALESLIEMLEDSTSKKYEEKS